MMARLAQALSGKLMNESHRMFFRRRHGSRIGWGIQRKLLADLIVGNLRVRSVAERLFGGFTAGAEVVLLASLQVDWLWLIVGYSGSHFDFLRVRG